MHHLSYNSKTFEKFPYFRQTSDLLQGLPGCHFGRVGMRYKCLYLDGAGQAGAAGMISDEPKLLELARVLTRFQYMETLQYSLTCICTRVISKITYVYNIIVSRPLHPRGLDAAFMGQLTDLSLFPHPCYKPTIRTPICPYLACECLRRYRLIIRKFNRHKAKRITFLIW